MTQKTAFSTWKLPIIYKNELRLFILYLNPSKWRLLIRINSLNLRLELLCNLLSLNLLRRCYQSILRCPLTGCENYSLKEF